MRAGVSERCEGPSSLSSTSETCSPEEASSVAKAAIVSLPPVSSSPTSTAVPDPFDRDTRFGRELRRQQQRGPGAGLDCRDLGVGEADRLQGLEPVGFGHRKAVEPVLRATLGEARIEAQHEIAEEGRARLDRREQSRRAPWRCAARPTDPVSAPVPIERVGGDDDVEAGDGQLVHLVDEADVAALGEGHPRPLEAAPVGIEHGQLGLVLVGEGDDEVW